MQTKRLMGMAAAMAMGAAAQAQTTWFVDDSGPGDPGPGNPFINDPLEDGTAAHPFNRIQEAIDAAVNGDRIEVQPGTYFEFGGVNMLGKRVTLIGVAGPLVTTLDVSSWNDNAIVCTSTENASTVIEGLRIVGGQAYAAAPGERGGGLYCNLSSPTIRNCIFEDNEADIGGAVYVNGGTPTFTGCVFVGNRADFDGGSTGGALYLNNTTASFTDCDFIMNSANGAGGAVVGVNVRGEFIGCEFEGNLAGTDGGGLSFSGSEDDDILVFDCEFRLNEAEEWGGGIYSSATAQSVLTRQSVFDGNIAGINGGAVANDGITAGIALLNCVLWGNSAGSAGGGAFADAGATVVASNSIIWENEPFASQVSGLVQGNNTTAEGGPIPGGSNFDFDPMFVDPANGDFRLTPGSPCIDAGSTPLLEDDHALDLGGLPRVVNDPDSAKLGTAAHGYFVDLGAHEWQPAAAPSACPGDLNGDGFINGADLGLMLGAWGGCP